MIGAGFHTTREMRAGYSNKELDTSMFFCNMGNEFSLEAAYAINLFVGNRTILYTGAGTNVSSNFNHEVMVINGQFVPERNHQQFILTRPETPFVFKSKSLFTTRLFAVLGVNLHRTQKTDITFQYRPGFGIQSIPQENINFLPYTGGYNIGFKIYFQERGLREEQLKMWNGF